MKLYSKTVSEYLISSIKPLVTGQTDGREIRIFLSSHPPSVIRCIGEELSNYFLLQPKKVKFEFKVGAALWENWQNYSDPELINR